MTHASGWKTFQHLRTEAGTRLLEIVPVNFLSEEVEVWMCDPGGTFFHLASSPDSNQRTTHALVVKLMATWEPIIHGVDQDVINHHQQRVHRLE